MVLTTSLYFSYRYDDYNRDEINKINKYSDEITIV